MLVLLSPSKTLETERTDINSTDLPFFCHDAVILNNLLKQCSVSGLMSLMQISAALAAKTFDKIHAFDDQFGPKSVRPAVLCFKGEVYQGLNASIWPKDDLLWAQTHLRILSGLYGILRPLDKMQDYRMEMGTPLVTPNGTGLYIYWKDKIANHLKQELNSHHSKFIINLASQEYFRVVEPFLNEIDVYTPEFKICKNGLVSFSSFHAKQARGLLAAFIIRNRIERPENILEFNDSGYQFEANLSVNKKWVFLKNM